MKRFMRIALFVLGLSLISVEGRADDGCRWDFGWLKKPHVDVYRPMVPCDMDIFHKHDFWQRTAGCFCKPSVITTPISTCRRPIFHRSHFAEYWSSGSAPTCRRPIFHENCWDCRKSVLFGGDPD